MEKSAVADDDLTYQFQRRQRPDRHPYQLGCLFGVLCVAISQLVIGIPPESVLHDALDGAALVTLNTTLIVGALLGLLGASLHRDRDPRLSLRLGIAGQISVMVGLASYTWTVIAITNGPYWLSLLGAGLGFGLTYAAGHRIIQQFQALKALKEYVDLVHPKAEPL
jgi:hypothetical protein